MGQANEGMSEDDLSGRFNAGQVDNTSPGSAMPAVVRFLDEISNFATLVNNRMETISSSNRYESLPSTSYQGLHSAGYQSLQPTSSSLDTDLMQVSTIALTAQERLREVSTLISSVSEFLEGVSNVSEAAGHILQLVSAISSVDESDTRRISPGSNEEFMRNISTTTHTASVGLHKFSAAASTASRLLDHVSSAISAVEELQRNLSLAEVSIHRRSSYVASAVLAAAKLSQHTTLALASAKSLLEQLTPETTSAVEYNPTIRSITGRNHFADSSARNVGYSSSESSDEGGHEHQTRFVGDFNTQARRVDQVSDAEVYCQFCPHLLPDLQSLYNHIKYNCSVVRNPASNNNDKTFSSCLQILPDNNRLKCHVCDYTTFDLGNLIKHAATAAHKTKVAGKNSTDREPKSEKKILLCIPCNVNVPYSLSQFKQHLNTSQHFCNTNQGCKHKVLDKNFVTRMMVTFSIDNFHNLHCYKCNKDVLYSGLQEHVRTCNRVTSFNVYCTPCSQIHDIVSFRKHKKSPTHKGKVFCVYCTFCGLVRNSYKELAFHQLHTCDFETDI